MSIVPLAINTFDFRTLVISQYNGSSWTSAKLFADDTAIVGGNFQSVSAGSVISALDLKRGAVTFAPIDAGPNAQMQFLGNGLPDTVYNITSTDLPAGSANQPVIGTFFDTTIGAWFFNGRWWLFAKEFSGVGQWGVFSTADPSIAGSWRYEDAFNGPIINTFGGGSYHAAIQYDPIANILYLFTFTGGTFDYGIFDFNFNTRVWTGPYAALTLTGRSTLIAQHNVVDCFNGLVHFSNGDFGIFYPRFTGIWRYLYYQLYNSGTATWGLPVVLNNPADTTDHYFGNLLVDPTNTDLLYVFWFTSDVSNPSHKLTSPHCSTVTHAGVITSAFDFPAVTPSVSAFGPDGTDGFGQGIILDSKIFMPLDYYEDTANAVWITPTSNLAAFVKTFLPVLPRDVGKIPSCTYMSFSELIPSGWGSGWITKEA